MADIRKCPFRKHRQSMGSPIQNRARLRRTSARKRIRSRATCAIGLRDRLRWHRKEAASEAISTTPITPVAGTGSSRTTKDLTDRKYLGPQEFTQRGNLLISKFDRKEIMNYELSLLYTQGDFSMLCSYYEKLQHLQMNEEATALLEKNRHRFVGNPLRTSFFAGVAEKEGDPARAS